MLDENRLLHLISAHFDRQLDADETRELESMLLGSARARQILCDRGEWHGLLREWALREQTGELMGLPELPDAPLPFRWKRWIAPALAACLAVAWFLHPWRPAEMPPVVATAPVAGTSDEVALVTQSVAVEWESGHPAYGLGSAVPRGWLKFRRGTLRLDFYSGAQVLLEGPVAIDLRSQDLARLERGKLTAHVPPPAQGFTVLNAADLRVVDRGTDFGMSVGSPNDCEVHVFHGEVELQGDVPAQRNKELFEGNGVAIRQGVWKSITADRKAFADPSAVMKAADSQSKACWQSWHTSSLAFRRTPGLLVYFDFEDLDAANGTILNRALGAPKSSDGSIIGCESGVGRWPGKSALCFAKTSDRIRFRTEGRTPSITLMAWVRVDSLPLNHNALLSMAPFQAGEIHWKLDQAGRLLLGLRVTDIKSDSWERLVSPCVITMQDFGRWMHLATVIDGESGMMKHYVNGVEVASTTMNRRPMIQLGMANLGNFDAAHPSQGQGAVVRNFNGRMDEFALFNRALSPAEIRDLK